MTYATGQGYITVEVPADNGGCSGLQEVHAASEASLGTDSKYDYPYGMVGFQLDCATSVDVTLIFHEPFFLPLTAYRKFGPIPPGFDTPQFYALPAATFGTAQIPPATGSTVATATFKLTNGQLGDDTPAGDGMIVDPGGPALPVSASAPAASRWGLIALAALLVAVAAFGVRRRSLRASASSA